MSDGLGVRTAAAAALLERFRPPSPIIEVPMTTRSTLTATAALALALAFTASAPAMAGCRSSMTTDVDGDDGVYDTRARDGAEWGVYARDYGHEVTGTVAGCGTRAVSGSLGRRTRTRLDVRGYDNMVGTEARSGGRINTFVRGDENELALRARNGSRINARVIGSGTYVRAEAY